MMELIDTKTVTASLAETGEDYQAVRGEGAGLIDLSDFGRLRVSGLEAVMFLNGLITNDVKALHDGGSMKAAFPNAQGRLLAMARVLRQKDDFLIFTEPTTAQSVAQNVGRFVFAGDFRVTELTRTTAHFNISGHHATQVMSAVLGVEPACLTQGHSTIIDWYGHAVTVLRLARFATDGFDCIIAGEHGPALRYALLDAGALSVNAETVEMLRLEAGQPRYGVDMDSNTVVLETGQDDAISYTKGCYVGQEIIARIHWRGHVAKRLTGLQCLAPADIAPRAEAHTPDGQLVGRITSATFSPQLGTTIALGYVRYAHLAAGTELVIIDRHAQKVAARVAELPFVR